MPTFLLDLRQSLRSLMKAPGFMIAATLTLALGIGANLATFSVLRAAYAPKLVWQNPGSLAFVGWKVTEDPARPILMEQITWPAFQAFQEHQTLFSSLGAYYPAPSDLGGAIDPRSVWTARVTPGFWSTLQMRPLLGRLPQTDEEGVLVISHGLWKKALGADPMALGKSFTVGGHAHVLVGVLPPEAQWQGSEVFVPLRLADAPAPGGESSFLYVFGRKRPGFTQAQESAILQTFTSQLQSVDPMWKVVKPELQPLTEFLYGGFRDQQKLLAWVALFVTALACVSLCTLVLGRCASRLQELGIRQALGATTTQLFMPLFSDLILAAIPATLVGWLFSLATTHLLGAFLPDDLRVFHGPSVLDVAIGMGAALLLAGLGAGLPALLLPRLRTMGILGGTRTSGGPVHRWSQKGLVALQVGLALTLLSSAALVGRSLQQLRVAPLGIATEGRLLATLSLPAQGEAGRTRRRLEVAQILEKLRALPGVEAVGATSLLPGVSGGTTRSLDVPGRPEAVSTFWRGATDGYFETVGLPLVAGRTFRTSDMVETPLVAVISQSLAKDCFPGQSPLGRTFRMNDNSYTVIGVVGDARMNGARQMRRTQTTYIPSAVAKPQLELVIKAPQALALLPEIRKVLRAHWPEVPMDQLRTLEEAVGEGFASTERRTTLLGLLAGLALALTATGIFGVLSRQVQDRRREVGIRLAMGGTSHQVAALIVRQAMGVVLVGLVAGMGGALVMGRVMQNQLFQIKPADPIGNLAALFILAVTALLACLIPALRVAQVQPSTALRSE